MSPHSICVVSDEKGFDEGVGSKAIDVISVLNKVMATLKAASKLFVCAVVSLSHSMLN